jgi:hypothetical protein
MKCILIRFKVSELAAESVTKGIGLLTVRRKNQLIHHLSNWTSILFNLLCNPNYFSHNFIDSLRLDIASSSMSIADMIEQRFRNYRGFETAVEVIFLFFSVIKIECSS